MFAALSQQKQYEFWCLVSFATLQRILFNVVKTEFCKSPFTSKFFLVIWFSKIGRCMARSVVQLKLNIVNVLSFHFNKKPIRWHCELMCIIDDYSGFFIIFDDKWAYDATKLKSAPNSDSNANFFCPNVTILLANITNELKIFFSWKDDFSVKNLSSSTKWSSAFANCCCTNWTLTGFNSKSFH